MQTAKVREQVRKSDVPDDSETLDDFYCVEYFQDLDGDAKAFEAMLNVMRDAGWKLISCNCINTVRLTFAVIFQRVTHPSWARELAELKDDL